MVCTSIDRFVNEMDGDGNNCKKSDLDRQKVLIWRWRFGIKILDWELGLYIGVWESDYRLGLGTQMEIRIDIDIQFENYILAWGLFDL